MEREIEGRDDLSDGIYAFSVPANGLIRFVSRRIRRILRSRIREDATVVSCINLDELARTQQKISIIGFAPFCVISLSDISASVFESHDRTDN